MGTLNSITRPTNSNQVSHLLVPFLRTLLEYSQNFCLELVVQFCLQWSLEDVEYSSLWLWFDKFGNKQSPPFLSLFFPWCMLACWHIPQLEWSGVGWFKELCLFWLQYTRNNLQMMEFKIGLQNYYSGALCVTENLVAHLLLTSSLIPD